MYAIVDANGNVTNIIVWDGISEFTINATLVPATVGVSIGWKYVGNKFVPPPPPVPRINTECAEYGIVPNAAVLRELIRQNGARVYLRCHTTEADGGHGVFRRVTGAAPGTYTHNGGTILVAGDGSAAWLRERTRGLKTEWFGLTGDGSDVTSVITTMAAIREPIEWGKGTFVISSPVAFENNMRGREPMRIDGTRIKLTGTGRLDAIEEDMVWENLVVESAVNGLTFVKVKTLGFKFRNFRLNKLGATGQTGIEFDTDVFAVNGQSFHHLSGYRINVAGAGIRTIGSGYFNGHHLGSHGDNIISAQSAVAVENTGGFNANSLGGYLEGVTNAVSVTAGAAAAFGYNRIDFHLDNVASVLNAAGNIDRPNWWKILPADWTPTGPGAVSDQRFL